MIVCNSLEQNLLLENPLNVLVVDANSEWNANVSKHECMSGS